MKLAEAGIAVTVATATLGVAGVFAIDAFDWTLAVILASVSGWAMWGLLKC